MTDFANSIITTRGKHVHTFGDCGWRTVLANGEVVEGYVPDPDYVEPPEPEPIKMTGEGRYRVVNQSESAHCCFEATVVDTSRPQNYVDGDRQTYEAVCECFEMADAELIATALNASAIEAGTGETA